LFYVEENKRVLNGFAQIEWKCVGSKFESGIVMNGITYRRRKWGELYVSSIQLFPK